MIISEFSILIMVGEYRILYELGFNNKILYNIYDYNGRIIYGEILQ